jgi:hypothetical protein
MKLYRCDRQQSHRQVQKAVAALDCFVSKSWTLSPPLAIMCVGGRNGLLIPSVLGASRVTKEARSEMMVGAAYFWLVRESPDVCTVRGGFAAASCSRCVCMTWYAPRCRLLTVNISIINCGLRQVYAMQMLCGVVCRRVAYLDSHAVVATEGRNLGVKLIQIVFLPASRLCRVAASNVSSSCHTATVARAVPAMPPAPARGELLNPSDVVKHMKHVSLELDIRLSLSNGRSHQRVAHRASSAR